MTSVAGFGGAGMVAYYVVLGICLIVPLLLGIVLAAMKKGSFLALAVGAATFLVFQVLTRIPLLGALPLIFPGLAELKTGSAGYWAYIVALCFSAGLFEEMGRYIAMRFLLKKRRGMWNGVVFGIGHGGFEAFVLVGLNYLIYLVLDFLPRGVLGEGVPTAREIVAVTPPVTILMAGFERVSAIIFHVSMSMIVMRMVMSGKGWLYVFIPIAAHGAFNMVSQVMISSSAFTILGVEMALCALALLALASALYYWRAVPDAAALDEAAGAMLDEAALVGTASDDGALGDAVAEDTAYGETVSADTLMEEAPTHDEHTDGYIPIASSDDPNIANTEDGERG